MTNPSPADALNCAREALAPCPFCGGKAEHQHNDEFGVHQLFCKACGAFGPFVDEAEPDAEAKAVAAWNGRFQGSLQ